jgi:hypothetical protein
LETLARRMIATPSLDRDALRQGADLASKQLWG